MQMRWLNLVAAVALVLGAASCGRTDGAAGPDALVAPPSAAVVTYKLWSTPDGYTLLSGASTSETSRSATLTVNGGKLSIGANQLVIPFGALDEPTKITFTMVDQPYMAARLTAVRVSDGALVTKFKLPLPLKISYAKSVTPIPDPTQLKIYYIVDGQVASTMPTQVDVKGQTLYTELNHFSEYSPGLDP